MDFNAKRLALLAGIGEPEVRHEIVREQADKLNESIEARKADEPNNPEDQVRLAVRSTIQKMIAEGTLSAKQHKSLDAIKDALLKGADAKEDPETGEFKVKFAADEKEEAVNESEDEEVEECGEMSMDEPMMDEPMMDEPPMMEEEEDLVSEGDDAVINELDDGSLTLEMGGKTYSLQEILAEDEELEEVEIPDDADYASVNDKGEVEFSKSVE